MYTQLKPQIHPCLQANDKYRRFYPFMKYSLADRILSLKGLLNITTSFVRSSRGFKGGIFIPFETPLRHEKHN